MLRRKKLGQSTAEYAIVIGLVIAAAVAMQVYVKRGIQAKVKGAVDFDPTTGITSPPVTFTGEQFEPNYSKSDWDTDQHAMGDTQTLVNGEVRRTITGTGDVNKRSGSQETKSLPAAQP